MSEGAVGGMEGRVGEGGMGHGNLKVGINNFSIQGEKKWYALFKMSRHIKGREAPN